MSFIESHLETVLSCLDRLEENTSPAWGTMTAQRMVEHLTESLAMSMGEGDHSLITPEEKISAMQAFLFSEKPMAKNMSVSFAPQHFSLRNESLELAIDEICEKWVDFELFYEDNPVKKALHPYYGYLDYNGWKALPAKHFTHHFLQFNLV